MRLDSDIKCGWISNSFSFDIFNSNITLNKNKQLNLYLSYESLGAFFKTLTIDWKGICQFEGICNQYFDTTSFLCESKFSKLIVVVVKY